MSWLTLHLGRISQRRPLLQVSAEPAFAKWEMERLERKKKLSLALHLDVFYPGSRKSPSEWAKDYRGEWN